MKGVGTFGILCLIGGLFLAWVAHGVETTPLDVVVNRKATVKTFVDEDNNVVCYYFERHPTSLECVPVK